MKFLVAIAVIVGSVALALSSVKLSSSTIDLDASAQTVSIGVTKDAVTLDPFVVTKAIFYGPGQIDAFGQIAPFESSFSVTRRDISLPLMTLQGLKLEPGVILTMKKQPGGELTFELFLDSPRSWQFSLFAQGHLESEADGSVRSTQSAAPQPFRVSLPKGPVRLAVTLAEEEWVERLPVTANILSFFDGGEKDGVPFRFSALDAGHVRFGEIELDDGKNKELELRAGQPFFIEPASAGVVRFLKLSKEGVALQYTGMVSTLGVGWNERGATSFMPSYLTLYSSKDWVRQGLSAIFAVLGLYLAFLQIPAARASK